MRRINVLDMCCIFYSKMAIETLNYWSELAAGMAINCTCF